MVTPPKIDVRKFADRGTRRGSIDKPRQMPIILDRVLQWRHSLFNGFFDVQR